MNFRSDFQRCHICATFDEPRMGKPFFIAVALLQLIYRTVSYGAIVYAVCMYIGWVRLHTYVSVH